MTESFSAHLRWVLLGIGIACVAAVYFYTVWVGRRRRSQLEGRQEPELAKKPSQQSADADKLEPDDLPETGAEASDDDVDQFSLPQDIEISQADKHALHSERLEGFGQEETSSDDLKETPQLTTPQDIIVLYVKQHKGNKRIAGKDFMHFASQKKLVSEGEADQRFFTSPTGSFYVTNMLQPGTFKWNEMHQSELTGVSFFFHLPHEQSQQEEQTADIFTEMSECAIALAEQLGAEVYDEQHVLLSEEKYRQIKETLLEYDRKRKA